MCYLPTSSCFFFFFNDTATTEIYTLSLHDALPISSTPRCATRERSPTTPKPAATRDRKSTRLNSSHLVNLVCRLLLEKKKKQKILVIEKHVETCSYFIVTAKPTN